MGAKDAQVIAPNLYGQPDSEMQVCVNESGICYLTTSNQSRASFRGGHNSSNSLEGFHTRRSLGGSVVPGLPPGEVDSLGMLLRLNCCALKGKRRQQPMGTGGDSNGASGIPPASRRGDKWRLQGIDGRWVRMWEKCNCLQRMDELACFDAITTSV